MADDEAPEPGEVLEVILPPLQLWILGAGDDSHRPAFARQERFPEADRVLAGHPAQRVPELDLDARSAVVLMTHHYQKDLEALRGLAASGTGYVGLMGSRVRSAKLQAELAEEGIHLGARLHSPVGLDLGAEDPETLALAILAEIQASFRGRSGGPLRALPAVAAVP